MPPLKFRPGPGRPLSSHAPPGTYVNMVPLATKPPRRVRFRIGDDGYPSQMPAARGHSDFAPRALEVAWIARPGLPKRVRQLLTSANVSAARRLRCCPTATPNFPFH